uniref:Translation initiation factor eIF2B subunit beta n=1 Tax=Tetraselmis sp. GSL018 TaxID=582737 RepID=A0A061R8H0_9CHLO|mmetsp:Transcript_41315/g.97983  ORF Transcript_41315/g.97983 Transcript_41315/m.97983 type:complete len:421 (-) Transcript_41315:303-1565(-)
MTDSKGRHEFEINLDSFCTELRRRQTTGSTPIARRTAEILRILIATRRHPDGDSLIEDVREQGARMQEANPHELAIGNMVRRVLSLIRDEHVQEVTSSQLSQGAPEEEQPRSVLESALSKAIRATADAGRSSNVGLHNLLDVGPVSPFYQRQCSEEPEAEEPEPEPESAPPPQPPKRKHSRSPQWEHKPRVLENVNELIEELDMIEGQISSQGLEHIHSNEVILTMNYSSTAIKFLQEAAKKREFQVVVAEGAPECDGLKAARMLAKSNVPTTVIADACIFAMMARVNKVILGAHAVLANGGVIAAAGSHMLALAAQRHAVPFVVLVGLHKLSPLFPHDPDLSFNNLRSPSGVVGYDIVGHGTSTGEDATETLVHVPNPQFDYIPPELVTIFVTDTGGYTPSYVYRLLAEYYKREDYALT